MPSQPKGALSGPALDPLMTYIPGKVGNTYFRKLPSGPNPDNLLSAIIITWCSPLRTLRNILYAKQKLLGFFLL